MFALSACAEGEADTKLAENKVKEVAIETVDKVSGVVEKAPSVTLAEAKTEKAKTTVKEAPAAEPMIMLNNFVEGKHYRVLSQTFPTQVADDEIEVREYFLYTCPHCFQAEKKVQLWKKGLADNVKFIPTPAIFRPNQELLARAYYVAKGLGVLDKTHMALFNRIHVNGKSVKNMDQLADFFKKHGVDKKSFEAANKSPIIINQLKQASKSIRAYQVTGVPAFIVNGKYLTNATMAGSGGYAKVLQIIDHLVEKEQKL